MTAQDERLAIPAKPAAVTAVNVAALSALAVAATGVGGAIVAAGAVAAGGAALAKKKTAARRATRMSAAGASPARNRRASSSTGTGARRSGLLGKMASAARRSGLPTPQSSAKRTTGRSTLGRAAGKLGLGKLARASRTATGTAKPSIMKRAASSRAAKATGMVAAGRGITKAAKWSAPKLRSALRRAVAAGATTKPSDTKTNPRSRWARARKWVQSSILRRKPKKTLTKKAMENVAAIVARRNRTAAATAATKRGITITRRAGRPVPARTTATLVTTPGGLPMKDAARNMWNYAATFEPRGMSEVIHELEDLPETLSHVAGAVGALMEKSQGKFPLDPAIVAQIGQVVESLYSAAAAAKKVPVAVHEIHAGDIKRLSQPRQGEEMWDLAVNGRV